MISKIDLRKILADQKQEFFKEDEFIDREINVEPYLSNNLIILISGVRRCGKSTLMKIIRAKLLEKGVKKENIFYCDFSDERLVDFKTSDFQSLFEVFMEDNPSKEKYMFFDEVQSIDNWEKFINRMYEKESAKVFVTGSNGTLLSSEMATYLTGRNEVIELYPFSFREFLKLNDIRYENIKSITTKETLKYKNLLYKYLDIGGFPYIIKTEDNQILSEYYKNIIYRDVIVRNSIEQVAEIKEIALFLFNNVGQTISYGKIQDYVKIKSVSTVKNYLDYLRNAFLFFTLSKYDNSVKKQILNPKKIYSIDTGLTKKLSVSISKNIGWLLENTVFLELLRRKEEIYYYKNGHECDFVLREGTKIKEAIQVTQELNRNTEEREISGLIAAMKEYGLKKGLILTEEQEETRKKVEGKYTIEIKPIWKWLLEY